jgi:hypothetical protein
MAIGDGLAIPLNFFRPWLEGSLASHPLRPYLRLSSNISPPLPQKKRGWPNHHDVGGGFYFLFFIKVILLFGIHCKFLVVWEGILMQFLVWEDITNWVLVWTNSISPSYCHSYVPKKMRWLLKSLFDQNIIVINLKPKDDFNSHIIVGGTQE